jgi:hypothetical protein
MGIGLVNLRGIAEVSRRQEPRAMIAGFMDMSPVYTVIAELEALALELFALLPGLPEGR